MKENPYAAPPTDDPDELAGGLAEDVPLSLMIRPIFLSWEKLRLVYNAILILITLGLMTFQSHLFSNVEFWTAVVFGALVANACFFLGPIIEAYVTWLGYRNVGLRVFLFISGTVVACILAFASVVFYDFPLPSQN